MWLDVHFKSFEQQQRFGEKTREVRLISSWFGRVRRKDDGYIVRWMPRMELPGKENLERPKMRLMDAMREGMSVVEVTEEDTEARTKWRWKIHCGDH